MIEMDEELLSQLTLEVEHGVKYLTLEEYPELQEGQTVADVKDEDVKKTRHFRFRSPSPNQEMEASIEKQRFLNKLRADKALRTRYQLEQEHIQEIEELRKEKTSLEKDMDEMNRELVRQLDVFEGEEEPTIDFEAWLKERQEGMDGLSMRIYRISLAIEAILGNSIDSLANKRYFAVLTALSWDKSVNDQWEPVWKDYKEFADDGSPVSATLMLHTMQSLQPGNSFFGV